MKPKITSARLLLCLLISGLVLLYAVPTIYVVVSERRCKDDARKVIQWIESEKARSGALPSSIGIPTRFRWHYQTGDDGHYRLRSKDYYGFRLILNYDSATDSWEVSHY